MNRIEFTKEELRTIDAYVKAGNNSLMELHDQIVKDCFVPSDLRMKMFKHLKALGLIDNYSERASAMFDMIINSWRKSYYEKIRTDEESAYEAILNDHSNDEHIIKAINEYGGIDKLLRDLE